MNLFFNDSISEFQQLIRSTIHDKAIHDVVIDNDGEVLIDPHVQQPELDLDRFKIHFQVDGNIQDFEKRPTLLRKLFQKMQNAWNTSLNTVA